MRIFPAILIIALLLIPCLASAYLSQDDEIALTADLEVLSAVLSDTAVLSANTIYINPDYGAGDWETYFNKYFNCSPSCAPNSVIDHPLTNALFNYLVNSAISGAPIAISEKNLQMGLIHPLWMKIRNITSAHPADLGRAMFSNFSLRQSLFNAHRLFSLLARNEALDMTSRADVYFNYKAYIKAYPNYFSDVMTIENFSQPFVALLRSQVWMSFIESLPLTPDLKNDIAMSIHLGGKKSRKLDIWNAFTYVLMDNNGLDQSNNPTIGLGQLDVYYNIINAIPVGMHSSKDYITVADFLEVRPGWRPIIAKGSYSLGRLNYELTIQPSNNVQFTFNTTNGPAAIFQTKTALAWDTWNHVAVTFDGTAVILYVNGVQDSMFTAPGLPNSKSLDAMTLGGELARDNQMRGHLDEVKVYSRALTSTEIGNEFNNQDVSKENLVAFYQMDETNGTLVKDSSGLLNNGTNVGGVTVAGKMNNGLSFNGKDSYVKVTDSSSLRLSRAITLEAWVFLPFEDVTMLVPGAGNIAGGPKIGTSPSNPFPKDILPIYIDSFSEVVVHEMNHNVGLIAISPNLNLAARERQLIDQAGSSALQYLRSESVNPDGTSIFPKGTQEFFASMSNQYFTDSWHMFDLAIQRFNKGYKEPINQFLFFADVYSKGGLTTKFFTLNKKGVLTVNNVPIYRDLFGNIMEITRASTNTIYRFILDFNGNVLYCRTLPITS